MSIDRIEEKKYYWVIREWYNKTTKHVSKISRGYPDYYFRHSMQDTLTDPTYTEIWVGTKEDITMLGGLRDYYSNAPEAKEKLLAETYAKMERIK